MTSLDDWGINPTSAWAIACYASVDDLAISSTHALGIGTSIDQSTYDQVTSDTAHNIYLTTTPLKNFTQEATTVKWLTTLDNAWTSVRDSVETIVVGDGITAIPDSCFYGFDFVQEAIVSSSVSRIGDQAFGACDSLRRVTLYPMSVEIGEDAFWTGSRWVGSETKVVWATLRCYKGSSVEQYAIDNNISYEYIREVFSGDMHRLYNPYSYEHFYTADADEFASLVDLGWQDEDIAWYGA